MHKVMFDKKSRISLQYHLKREIGRMGEQFEIARIRTEVGRHSLRYRGPVAWNALSTNLKEQRNLKTFKCHLKSNLGILNQINFAKGITFNRNKDIINYILLEIPFYTILFCKLNGFKLHCLFFLKFSLIVAGPHQHHVASGGHQGFSEQQNLKKICRGKWNPSNFSVEHWNSPPLPDADLLKNDKQNVESSQNFMDLQILHLLSCKEGSQSHLCFLVSTLKIFSSFSQGF